MPPKGKGKKSKKQLEEERRKYFWNLSSLMLFISNSTNLNDYFLAFLKFWLRRKDASRRSSRENLPKKKPKGRESLKKSVELKRRRDVRRKRSA